MRKIFGLLALFVLMASSVFASDLDLDPEIATMAPTDVKIVTACITEGGAPLVGIDLNVTIWCKNLNGNPVCDGADSLFPVEFTPVVTKDPTNASGCGEVTLTTVAASSGEYRYRVNGLTAGVEVAAETGIVLIPEFTTIGAGLVLAGAGYYIYRRRSRK